MTVYMCLLILCGLLYVFLKKYQKYHLYFIVMMVILFLVSSLRGEMMGNDYRTYIYIFEYIVQDGKIILTYGMEWGYLFLLFVVRQLTNNYICVGVTANIIIFGLFYRYIKKYVEQEYYILIMYVFLANPYFFIQSSFNILRQGIATAIILCGIEFLYERQWAKYCLIILFAAQFHTSSLIFLFLCVIRLINWTRKKLLIVLCVSTALNLVVGNVSFLYSIVNIFGYGGYIDEGRTEFDFVLYVLFIFLVVVFFLNFYSKLHSNDKEKFFVDIYLLGLSLLPVFVINDIMYRVYIIFGFISFPALPIICKSFKNMKSKTNYYAVISAYFFYYLVMFTFFLITMYVTKNTSYIPFRFFWQI